MTGFIHRNIQLFFRDKTTVIMSLLAQSIIMVLYIIFIRDNLMDRFNMINNAEIIMDMWMISGILGITPVTASMGAYTVMIDDKSRKIYKDFAVSPASNFEITMGYILAAAAAAVIMSIIVLLISQAYMYFNYGIMVGEGRVIQIIMVILLNSLTLAFIVILPVSFFNNSNQLSACCTIIGSLLGFLAGIYLPIGSLSENVKMLVLSFPVSHSVGLLRQNVMYEELTDTFIDISAANDFKEYMGVDYYWNDIILQPIISIDILIGYATICLLLICLKISISERFR